MDDCFKSMFAYTDCIPQVCDELIKSIFPGPLSPRLTPAGGKGNSHGALGTETLPAQAGTVLGFHSPQQKQICGTAAEIPGDPLDS